MYVSESACCSTNLNLADFLTNKLFRHARWDEKPLWNKNTVKFPLVGRIAQALRRGNMMTTHCFMGFGKDPQPN